MVTFKDNKNYSTGFEISIMAQRLIQLKMKKNTICTALYCA